MSALQKVRATNWSEWNHPWTALVLSSVFALVGFSIGFLALPHVITFDSLLLERLSIALFGGAVTIGGIFLLAVVD